MGAWGYKVFQDDTTCDWLYDLYDAEDPHDFLLSSLNPEEVDGYLEYSSGCSILGAAEVVYSLLFEIRDNPPQEFQDWILKNQGLTIVDLKENCVQSLSRVLSEDSELNELWSDSGEDYTNWRGNIEIMMNALRS